jgi:hypothetical protein
MAPIPLFLRTPGLAPSLAMVALLLSAEPRAQAMADTGLGFFITSANPGKGANLGGLSGADAHCKTLAEAVGAGDRQWRAYLSTQATAGEPAVNARDRIGSGPWYNAKGVRVATSVADLHSAGNKLGKENSLTEKGTVVNGRGDSPNRHDILTGTRADGTAFGPGADSTCRNWSSESTGNAMLGHHDRQGISSNIDPASWNQAHLSSGCGLSALQGTGGNGYFYCFAADGATGLGNARPTLKTSGFALLFDSRALGNGKPVYRLDLPARSRVAVEISTLNGRKIGVLRSGILEAGVHEIDWDGRDAGGMAVSRGYYLIGVTIE